MTVTYLPSPRPCFYRDDSVGNYKGIAQGIFPDADRFLSILGSTASLFNASGRIVGGLSVDR